MAQQRYTLQLKLPCGLCRIVSRRLTNKRNINDPVFMSRRQFFHARTAGTRFLFCSDIRWALFIHSSELYQNCAKYRASFS